MANARAGSNRTVVHVRFRAGELLTLVRVLEAHVEGKGWTPVLPSTQDAFGVLCRLFHL